MTMYKNLSGDASSAIGAVANIGISTLFAMSDKKKAKKFEQELQQLSSEQQKQLDKALSEITSQTQREQYIVDFVLAQKAQKLKGEQDKKRAILLIFLALAGVGVVIIFIKLKNKK